MLLFEYHPHYDTITQTQDQWRIPTEWCTWLLACVSQQGDKLYVRKTEGSKTKGSWEKQKQDTLGNLPCCTSDNSLWSNSLQCFHPSFTHLVALLESESTKYYPSLFLMENQKRMAQNEVDLSQQSKQPEFLSITTLSALITFYQSYNR